MRISHVIAGFIGVVLVGWAQWADPTFPSPNPVVTVAFTAVLFGLLWECVIRLSRLAKGLLPRKSRH